MLDPKRPAVDSVVPPADTPVPGDSQSTPYFFSAHPGPVPIPGYELLEPVGRGGMGVVYKARQLALNRLVAIKLMPNAETAGPRTTARFITEAQSVAQVRHPNVVEVYDFGEARGFPYLVMELLDGGHLGDATHPGPRPDPRAVAAVLARVARGVAAVHAAGIVHRDLKPNNILFSSTGEPKVVDFGLAKRSASNLTQSVAVMGTPYYMSPEQAQGKSKSVGSQTDVWAVGVILYECLTGCRPFDSDNQFSLLHQIVTAEPDPPRVHNAALPPDLEAIILTCLRKKPEQRYATAAKLAEVLERFARGSAVVPRPAPPRPVRYGVVGVILALFFLCVTALWLWQAAEAEKRQWHQKAREGQADRPG